MKRSRIWLSVAASATLVLAACGGAEACGRWARRWRWPCSTAWPSPRRRPTAPTGNPLSATYATKDGKYLTLTCLQAAKYWPEVVGLIGQPELATDERFADAASITANVAEATALLREAFAQGTADEWRERFADFSGQWTMVQDMLEATVDPQSVANGYVQDCETADGTPFQLAAAPVQFDGQAAAPQRAPEFNEHADDILATLGLDTEAILDLKIRGVVA